MHDTQCLMSKELEKIRRETQAKLKAREVENKELREKIDKAVEALEFYKNHRKVREEGAYGVFTNYDIAWKAREVLKQIKEGK